MSTLVICLVLAGALGALVLRLTEESKPATEPPAIHRARAAPAGHGSDTAVEPPHPASDDEPADVAPPVVHDDASDEGRGDAEPPDEPDATVEAGPEDVPEVVDLTDQRQEPIDGPVPAPTGGGGSTVLLASTARTTITEVAPAEEITVVVDDVPTTPWWRRLLSAAELVVLAAVLGTLAAATVGALAVAVGSLVGDAI